MPLMTSQILPDYCNEGKDIKNACIISVVEIWMLVENNQIEKVRNEIDQSLCWTIPIFSWFSNVALFENNTLRGGFSAEALFVAHLFHVHPTAAGCAYRFDRDQQLVILHNCIKNMGQRRWCSGGVRWCVDSMWCWELAAVDHFLLAGSDALRGTGGLASSSAARAINRRCFSAMSHTNSH
jgi:hypothetical protein